MKLNDLVRLGPWFGRVTDLLESTTTGERYARVKLVKHWAGITEICAITDLAPATEAQVQQAMDAVRERQETGWLEILSECDAAEETTR